MDTTALSPPPHAAPPSTAHPAWRRWAGALPQARGAGVWGSAVLAGRAWVIGVCLAVLAVSGWFLAESRQHQIAQARQLTVLSTRAAAGHLDTLLRQVDGVTAALADSIEQAGDGRPSAHRLGELTTVLTLDAPHLAEVVAYDVRGRSLVHAGRGRAERDPQRVLDSDFFAFHRQHPGGGPHVGASYYSPASGGWVIPVSRRIAGADGRLRGVVVAALDVGYLADHFGHFDLGRNWAVGLVDAQGRVLLRLPFRLDAQGADLRGSGLDVAALPPQGRSFTARSPFDANERHYTAIRLPGNRLAVMTGVDAEEMLAPWRKTALAQGLVVLALVLLVLALGHRLVDGIAAQGQLGRTLEAANARLNTLMKAIDSHAALVVTDHRGHVLEVNRRFCEISGHEAHELIGEPVSRMKSGLHDAAFYADMWSTIRAGRVWKGELLNRGKDGQTHWVDATIVPSPAEPGEPPEYISIRTDITALKDAELALAQAKKVLEFTNARLAAQASTDALTGLANRRRFDEALQAETRRAARDGRPLALLMLDVDHFKLYNDRYGHPAGDACLARVSERLRLRPQREGDVAARYGGEEFALLLPGTDVAAALRIAESLRAEVQALALHHAGNPAAVVTLSVGVAAWLPPAHAEPADLLAAADAALYRAKRQGRNRVAVSPVSPVSGAARLASAA